MKLHRTICIAVLFSILLLAVFTISGFTQTKVSKPGEYSGYSEPIYDGWKRFSQYVAVRDGTRLAVDIYRPTSGNAVTNTPHPVIFVFTPYRRASYDASGNLVMAAQNDFKAQGGLVSMTKYGYVVAYADARGTGASYGFRKAANNQVEGLDARDVTEWLGSQPWSTGKVGITGCSYVGQTVLEALRNVPSHLVAAMPGCTDFNAYDAKGRGGLVRGPSSPDAPYTADLISAPVDEDDANKTLLKAAVEEHKYNTPQFPFLNSLPYRDSYSSASESYWWQEVSDTNYMKEIRRSNIPIYGYGGWNDLMRRDTMTMFANWPNPRKLLVGPWPHCGYTLDTSFNLLKELHRFFDYWLKDIDNGVMKEPPIYHAAVNAPAGDEWRFAADWPPADVKQVTYFLKEGRSGSAPSVNDGLLNGVRPSDTAAKDNYTSDYSITTNIDWYAGLPRPLGTVIDQKGLTYTTAPLENDLTVKGHSMATLWVSSSTPDAAFWAILEDVYPDGTSYVIADGRLRASLRSIQKPPYNFLGLPWHRAYQADEQLLTADKIVKLDIDILPTTHIFKAGHRIRLAITNTIGGMFVNLPKYDPASLVMVYRNKIHASSLTLPVVAKPSIFTGTVRIHRRDIHYEGSAELYPSPTAIYMKYGDKWLKWKTIESRSPGKTEHYFGKGKTGSLSVLIKNAGHASFDALATGSGIYFKGDAQY
jgi:uncharacterized protein